MNATTATRGAFRPTAMTTKVRVAARLYAGAVEATPITMLETRPSAPLFRPLSCDCSVGCADAVVAMPHPPGFDPRTGIGIGHSAPPYRPDSLPHLGDRVRQRRQHS